MTDAIHTRVPCEVCGSPMYGYWGWDETPLCRAHFIEAEDRIMAAERDAEAGVLKEVKHGRD